MNVSGKHIGFGVALVLVAASLAACAGFDLGDVVRVKVPGEIRRDRGLPRTVTLNEAESEYRAWHAEVEHAGSAFLANIERGDEIRGLLDQLTLSALNEAGPMLAGVPIAGPALPALTGLAGLVLGSKRLRTEKEASFNKGLREGRAASGAPA